MNASTLPATALVNAVAVRILDRVSDEFWWDVARHCEYATFYHTPIWRDLTARIFPNRYQDETFGVILRNGVRAVFPIVSSRRLGPLRRLDSMPLGGYGGFIADGPVSPADTVAIYKHALAWPTCAVYLVCNPLGSPLPEGVRSLLSLEDCEIGCTLPLGSSFEEIFSRFSRTQRQAYRRGLRKGVQIRLAETLQDYRDFYVNYLDALDRWGLDKGRGYNREEWEIVYQMSRIYPEQIKLWLMIVGERIVGGRCVFYWGRHATGWNGTAHRDFLDHDVMPVADTEIIRDAVAQGYRYFDFSISGHKQGVLDYKLRFRPNTHPQPVWVYKNPIISASNSVFRRLLDIPTAKPIPPKTRCQGNCVERYCD